MVTARAIASVYEGWPDKAFAWLSLHPPLGAGIAGLVICSPCGPSHAGGLYPLLPICMTYSTYSRHPGWPTHHSQGAVRGEHCAMAPGSCGVAGVKGVAAVSNKLRDGLGVCYPQHMAGLVGRHPRHELLQQPEELLPAVAMQSSQALLQHLQPPANDSSKVRTRSMPHSGKRLVQSQERCAG